MMFITVLLELGVLIFAANVRLYSKTDDYTIVITNYFQCLLTNAQLPCDRPPDGEAGLAVATWYLFLAELAGVGVFVFFVFGTTPDIFFFWCRVSFLFVYLVYCLKTLMNNLFVNIWKDDKKSNFDITKKKFINLKTKILLSLP
jgi:hypothetical protein